MSKQQESLYNQKNLTKNRIYSTKNPRNEAISIHTKAIAHQENHFLHAPETNGAPDPTRERVTASTTEKRRRPTSLISKVQRQRKGRTVQRKVRTQEVRSRNSLPQPASDLFDAIVTADGWWHGGRSFGARGGPNRRRKQRR